MTETASEKDKEKEGGTRSRRVHEDEAAPVDLEPEPPSAEELRQRGYKPAPKLRLSWLIDDFHEKTSSVYEAVMVAANRARQVGRRQKQEIDHWNAIHDVTESVISPDSPAAEPGIDHFHHPKPTVQALDELKRDVIRYTLNEERQK